MTKGIPLRAVYPKEGLIYSRNPVSILSGTKHPKAARAWGGHTTSKEAQEWITKNLYTVSLVVFLVMSFLSGVDRGLVEAARSLGASEWIAVRRVIFPAVVPGLLAFVNSMQNYSMSLMVSPEGFKTLPLDLGGFIFAETGAYSNFNLAAAVSLCLMLFIVACLWAVRLITKQTWFENLNF